MSSGRDPIDLDAEVRVRFVERFLHEFDVALRDMLLGRIGPAPHGQRIAEEKDAIAFLERDLVIGLRGRAENRNEETQGDQEELFHGEDPIR